MMNNVAEMNLNNGGYLKLQVLLKLALVFISVFSCSVFAAELVGFAEMPKLIHVEGPTTNQFANASAPTNNHQIMQGVSSILPSGRTNQFYFLVDNGFGQKYRSADALLRVYEAQIDFSRGDVAIKRHLNINDLNKKLGFNIQADYKYYYNDEKYPKVPIQIKSGRLLTGADIDPESIQIDDNGNIWIGDEYGPFLLEVSADGKVIGKVVPLPDVAAPENPYLNGESNILSSAGFEAMGINPRGTVLYPMLERSVVGDNSKTVRIYQFDIKARQYTNGYFLYRMDEDATKVTDMVAVNDTKFLILERNSGSKSKHDSFKKVYLIDLSKARPGEYIDKSELLDLMKLEDPLDLDGDGEETFAFSHSLESLLILDESTLLVSNDNNYGGSTYFIKVKLDQPLAFSRHEGVEIQSSQWELSQESRPWFDFERHSFFGWMTLLAYFLTSMLCAFGALSQLFQRRDFFFWLLLTLLLIFLGLNKHFHLHNYITEMLRGLAKSHGWYGERRRVQMLFIVMLGLLLPIIFFIFRTMLAQLWLRYRIIITGSVLLIIFIVVRAASFHHVQAILYTNIGSIRLYQLIELLIISLIFIGSLFKIKAISRST